MKDYMHLKRLLTKIAKSVATNVMVTLMSLIITLNNFTFNDKNYLQVKGCAMGTISAPPFANIFMGKFEDTHIYPHIQQFCKLYLRYTDDLFLMWTGTKDQLKEFISNLNNQHSSIKFTYKISNTSIDFLDTAVYIKNRRIHTSIYKKTHGHTKLPPLQLETPENTEKQHPIRKDPMYQTNLLRSSGLLTKLQEMLNKFNEIGYPKITIREASRKSTTFQRENLLKNKKKKISNRIPLVVTYNRTLPPLGGIINKHWNILQIDPKMKGKFNDRSVPAYRRCKNLRDITGSSRFSNNKVVRSRHGRGECKPCILRSDSQCCRKLKQTTTFLSKTTNKSFYIRHKLNCKSSSVIYLMDCLKCGKQS